jgi:hypothetical protein
MNRTIYKFCVRFINPLQSPWRYCIGPTIFYRIFYKIIEAFLSNLVIPKIFEFLVLALHNPKNQEFLLLARRNTKNSRIFVISSVIQKIQEFCY